MTREEAEKIALEMYPVAEQTFKSEVGDFYTTYDVNERPRKAFMEAYQIFMDDNASVVKKAAEEAAEYAKRQALKNCPKWKRAERAIDSDCIDYAVLYRNDGGDYEDYDTVIATNRLHKGELYIELCDLENLLEE